MPRFEVEFYETVKGEQPAKEFLLSLDKKMRGYNQHSAGQWIRVARAIQQIPVRRDI